MNLLPLFVRRTFFLFLVCINFLSALTFSSEEKNWISKHPVVTLGSDYSWAPYDFADDKGRHIGIAADFLALVSQKSGLKFDVKTGIWSEILDEVKQGKLDGLSCAVSTPLRKEYLNFSTPYVTMPLAIIVQNHREDIKTIEDLYGKTVSINKGSYLHEWLVANHPQIKLKLTTSNNISLEAVSVAKADAFVGNIAVATYIMRNNYLSNLKIVSRVSTLKTKVSVAIVKENKILQNIIEKTLKSISHEEKQIIIDRWFVASQTANKTIKLTQKERKWIKENPIVKVSGEFDWAPFDFVENDVYMGISNDYLNFISQKTGLKFEVKADLWKNSLQKMKEGKIDLMPAVYYKEDRTQYMNFSKSYFDILDYIFIRDDLNVKTMADLDGKTVAIPSEYIHIDIMKEKFPNINILEVETLSHAIAAVIEKKADILFDTYAVIKYTLKKQAINSIIPFKAYGNGKSNELYMTTSKTKPLLSQIINKGLDAISIEEKELIYKKWMGERVEVSKKLNLTKPEEEWIKTHPNIQVGIDNAWEPFDFRNEYGKHEGMSADYLQLISEKTDLNFVIAEHETWSDVLLSAKDKKIDMIAAIAPSKERAKYLNFTDSYMRYAFVLATANKENFFYEISDFVGKRVGVIKGYVTEDLLRDKYPNIKVVTYENMFALLEGLSLHEVDAVFDNAVTMAYHIKKQGYSHFKMMTIGEHKRDITIGVNQDNTLLLSILNKALKSISEEEKHIIRDKWVSFEYDKTIDYTLVYQILGLFLFFILGTWYWYRKLSFEVSKRKESEAQMSMLIDNIPLNVIVSGFDGSVLRANVFALESFKISAEDLDKYNVMTFYADPSERDDIIGTIKSEGKIKNRIVKFKRLDETLMDIMISIMPIQYDGAPALLSIMVDLTERIGMEEDLRQARETADRANKSKSEFLANMSHEIRTPMNAIIGFTELLNEQIKTPRLKSYTKTIKNAGNTLLTLINDILDLSKIEAGKLDINKTAVNVNDLANDVASIFSMVVGGKGLSIIVDVDDTIPKSLLLDSIRLRQILVNLIGNAVKFTEEGYIKLSIHASNVDEHLSKLDLEISVEDTGIGIVKEQQERIFNSFEQQDGQDNRKYGGTGLGLTISKRLVEMMGGDIRVQSISKKGTTFTICLFGVDISSVELVEDASSIENVNEKIIFKPAKVLVVDDIEDNRELIINNFEDTAIEIITAADGFEAIEQYKKEKPDLILMDIRMPNMDGYEATSKIREISNIPIIALTASVMQDKYEQAKSKDFNGYLRKPVLRNDLFLELSNFLGYEKEEYEKDLQEAFELNLSEYAMQNIVTIVEVLESEVMPLYEKAVSSNNIAEMQVFTSKLDELAQKYEIDAFKEYIQQFSEAMDTFDIIQMQSLLREYTRLQEELKAL